MRHLNDQNIPSYVYKGAFTLAKIAVDFVGYDAFLEGS